MSSVRHGAIRGRPFEFYRDDPNAVIEEVGYKFQPVLETVADGGIDLSIDFRVKDRPVGH